eukprot:jgi/Botrbrau1/2107/Bobra.0093s0014.2
MLLKNADAKVEARFRMYHNNMHAAFDLSYMYLMSALVPLLTLRLLTAMSLSQLVREWVACFAPYMLGLALRRYHPNLWLRVREPVWCITRFNNFYTVTLPYGWVFNAASPTMRDLLSFGTLTSLFDMVVLKVRFHVQFWLSLVQFTMALGLIYYQSQHELPTPSFLHLFSIFLATVIIPLITIYCWDSHMREEFQQQMLEEEERLLEESEEIRARLADRAGPSVGPG